MKLSRFTAALALSLYLFIGVAKPSLASPAPQPSDRYDSRIGWSVGRWGVGWGAWFPANWNYGQYDYDWYWSPFAYRYWPAFYWGAPAQQVGSWCNTTTAEGPWAISFGYPNAQFHCQRTQSAIAPNLTNVSSWGYYSVYGWNQVQVQCANMGNFMSGQGYFPLQLAFEWAQQMEAKSCRFYVFW